MRGDVGPSIGIDSYTYLIFLQMVYANANQDDAGYPVVKPTTHKGSINRPTIFNSDDLSATRMG